MIESSYTNNLSPASDTDSVTSSSGNATAVHKQPLTDRLAQGAHHTIDRLVETATPRIERMEEAFVQTSEQLKVQAQHVREKGDEWANDLRATVRRNPLSAVAAAMALGALIARVTR